MLNRKIAVWLAEKQNKTEPEPHFSLTVMCKLLVSEYLKQFAGQRNYPYDNIRKASMGGEGH